MKEEYWIHRRVVLAEGVNVIVIHIFAVLEKEVEDEETISEMPKFSTPKISAMKDVFSKFSTKSQLTSIPEQLQEEAKTMINNPMLAINELRKQEEKNVSTSSDVVIEVSKTN